MNAKIVILFFAVNLFAAEAFFVPTPPEKPLRFCKAYQKWLNWAIQDSNYVEISHYTDLAIDLRYATFDNMTGHDLYCGSARAFLHKDAAKKLLAAIRILSREAPRYRLRIYDAARPLYAQESLRAQVRGTPFSNYVSSPSNGSLHNYGYAIDLTIEDENGKSLDMGTPFDSFEYCAGYKGEAEALKRGRLTKVQVANRNLLRSVMRRAGFISLASEWWHFGAAASSFVKENISKTPF